MRPVSPSISRDFQTRVRSEFLRDLLHGTQNPANGDSQSAPDLSITQALGDQVNDLMLSASDLHNLA